MKKLFLILLISINANAITFDEYLAHWNLAIKDSHRICSFGCEEMTVKVAIQIAERSTEPNKEITNISKAFDTLAKMRNKCLNTCDKIK